MSLTTSTFFSILINDSPSLPSPHLRISNKETSLPLPFYPYGGRTWAFNQSRLQQMGTGTGLNLHGKAQPATHQQFVDDTMLMGILTAQEAQAIKQVLLDFMEASGKPPSTR
jgi:hypothetical protein